MTARQDGGAAMTEISTYGQAKGNSLVPLATNDATEHNGGPTLLCPRQDKITITFDDEGNIAITQKILAGRGSNDPCLARQY